MAASDAEQLARRAAERFKRGRVVPFLGAGVNLSDRERGEPWRRGANLPLGKELAKALADRFGFPEEEEAADDLMRVAQYVDAAVGEAAVYDELRDIFAGDFEPTSVHRVLAGIPSLLREQGAECPNLLIVTTNYDDAQERAFADAGEECDVLWYMARGEHRGRFLHRPPSGDPVPVEDPSTSPLSVRERSVVVKIHGAAWRTDGALDSYVVTEDDYIEYMSETTLDTEVPARLVETMLESHFLFIGYRLSDWNLRVFLHGLWSKRDREAKNWAVDAMPRELDALFWQQRSVDMITVPLAEFMSALETEIRR